MQSTDYIVTAPSIQGQSHPTTFLQREVVPFQLMPVLIIIAITSIITVVATKFTHCNVTSSLTELGQTR